MNQILTISNTKYRLVFWISARLDEEYSASCIFPNTKVMNTVGTLLPHHDRTEHKLVS